MKTGGLEVSHDTEATEGAKSSGQTLRELEQTIDGLDGAIGEPSLQESYDTAPMFLGDSSTQYSDAWLQVRRACSYTAIPKCRLSVCISMSSTRTVSTRPVPSDGVNTYELAPRVDRNSSATVQYSSAPSTATLQISTLAPLNLNSQPNNSRQNLADADPPTGAAVDGQQHLATVSASIWRILPAAYVTLFCKNRTAWRRCQNDCGEAAQRRSSHARLHTPSHRTVSPSRSHHPRRSV
jgi:hypothetical protein